MADVPIPKNIEKIVKAEVKKEVSGLDPILINKINSIKKTKFPMLIFQYIIFFITWVSCGFVLTEYYFSWPIDINISSVNIKLVWGLGAFPVIILLLRVTYDILMDQISKIGNNSKFDIGKVFSSMITPKNIFLIISSGGVAAVEIIIFNIMASNKADLLAKMTLFLSNLEKLFSISVFITIGILIYFILQVLFPILINESIINLEGDETSVKGIVNFFNQLIYENNLNKYCPKDNPNCISEGVNEGYNQYVNTSSQIDEQTTNSSNFLSTLWKENGEPIIEQLKQALGSLKGIMNGAETISNIAGN